MTGEPSPAPRGGTLEDRPPNGGDQAAWLRLLVLQPSPFCNINCDYCYLPDRTLTHRMSMDTLRRTMEAVFATDLVCGEITLVWHAGEPLAVPVAWYEEAFACIRSVTPPGVEVIHSFQSNGTLINEVWCDLIRRHNVHLGLSIDGPEEIHDAHRRTRKGRGTHGQAMRGARLLREHGIPFHVIAVITRESLGRADEIFDFFVANGMRHFGFNVEELEGTHTETSLDGSTGDGVAEFFRRMFERQAQARGAVRIREFDGALNRITSAYGESGLPYDNEQVRPFGILSVDWQGNFSTWSPELLGLPSPEFGDFNLGNVHAGSFPEVAGSAKFQRLLGDIQAGVERCRAECRYFAVCGGGAPANKYFENGSFASTETLYCRYSLQIPTDLVLASLEADLGIAP